MKFVLAAAVGAAILYSVAHASILKLPAQMYCGQSDEVAAALVGYAPKYRGQSGSEGKTIGEVWAGKDGWFFVQIVPSQNMTCIVLGGIGKLETIEKADSL